MSQREDTGSSVEAKPLLAEIQRLHHHVQQQPAPGWVHRDRRALRYVLQGR